MLFSKLNRSVLSGWVLGLVLAGNVSAEMAVGVIPGNVEVNNKGEATISIPISVPPGTAGVVPKLSISGSSHGNDGMLGVGFALSGLSSISRGGTTLIQDGFVDGVDYDDNDRFFLDGQRLVVVAGTYGEADSEYRTEIDSFSKVVAEGVPGSPPSSFKVWTKSGLIYEYGNTEDSFVNPGGRPHARTWAVNKVSDTCGNYMTFEYDELKGQSYIARISYTGHDGTPSVTPYNTVEFVYRDRQDVSYAYHRGSLITRDRLLDKIVVKADGEFVRAYRFTYIYNHTGRQILDNVTLLLDESGETYLPPTRFVYKGIVPGASDEPESEPEQTTESGFFQSFSLPWLSAWEREWRDYKQFWHRTDDPVAEDQVENDPVPVFQMLGLSDIAFIADGAENNVFRNDKQRLITSDFNGDGLTDVANVHPDNDSKYSWIGLANGDGSFTYRSGTAFIPNGTTNSVFRDKDSRIMTGDFNGDGLSDLLNLQPDNDSGHSWMALSRGDGTFTFKNGPTFLPSGSEGNCYRSEDSRFIAGDFNGDAITDIANVHASTNSQHSWIGLGTVWGTFSFSNGTDFIPNAGSGTESYRMYRDKESNIVSGDFNGDGLTDFLNAQPNKDERYPWMALSNGDGTFRYINDRSILPASGANSAYRSTSSQIFTGDFNGDGLTDLVNVQPHNESKYSWIALSKGNGRFVFRNGTDFIPEGSVGNVFRGSSQQIMVADFNGDGRSDFANFHKSTDIAGYSWFAMSRGNGTFRYASADVVFPGDRYQGSGQNLVGGDFNGNGFMDIANIQQSNSSGNCWMADGSSEPFMLWKVLRGYIDEKHYASITEISYSTLLNTNLYQRGSGVSYPIRDVLAPMKVVSSLAVDTGFDNRHYTDYSYSTYRVHLKGRGSLGFETFESYDRQTQMTRIEQLAQEFPITGMSRCSYTMYLPDPGAEPVAPFADTLVRTDNTILYDNVQVDGVVQPGVYFPYISKSIERKYKRTDGLVPLSEATTYNWFDQQDPDTAHPEQVTLPLPGNIQYGNLNKLVIDYGEGSRTTTESIFQAVDPSRWILGRLQSSTVTHEIDVTGDGISDPSETMVKNAVFGYDTATGLLEWETSEPDHATLTMTTDYEYDAFGNILSKTVSGDGIAPRTVARNVYDSRGQFVVESRNALNHVQTQVTDPKYGQVTSSTGPNGLTTTWEYDGLGRPVRELRPDGMSTTTTYSWNDCPSFYMADPFNPGTHLLHISYYSKTTEADGVPPVTVYYDRQDREIHRKTTGPDGRTVLRDIRYNLVGQTIQASDNYFEGEKDVPVTQYTFDEIGRPKTTIHPDGTISEVQYDGLSTTTIVDSSLRSGTGNDAPKHQRRTVVKNVKGQVLSSTGELGDTIEYKYDAMGRLVKTIDSDSNEVVLSYDEAGNKIVMNDPDMGNWTYDYDCLGQMLCQTDASGNKIYTAYDALGRIHSRTNYLNNSGTLELESTASYEYDGTGEGCWLGTPRREVLKDGDGNITYRKTFAYDTYGRPLLSLVNFDNKWYYTTTRYDQLGRPEHVDQFWRPKGKEGDAFRADPEWKTFGTQNHYNEYGAVTEVTDSTGYSWWKVNQKDAIEDFDASGRLLAYHYGNGALTRNTFDRLTGNLERIECRNEGSTYNDIQDLGFAYDRVGNLTLRSDTRRFKSESFTFDGLNRLLTSEVNGSGTVKSVTYDLLGNITSKTGVGSYAYGSGNAGPHAVSSANGFTYTYDQNGNMIGRNETGGPHITTSVWTSFNKVKSLYVINDDTGVYSGSRFTYDANNNRITQIIQEGSQVTKKKIYLGLMEQEETLVDPSAAESEWEWENKLTRVYVATPAGTVGVYLDRVNDITRKYLHKDHLGSTTEVTGASVNGGNAPVLCSYSYDAWGKQRNASDWSDLASYTPPANGIDRGFTGHEMLAHIGLIHMNARLYDSTLGRFLSADTIIQSPFNSQSYNRYSYCDNNPLSRIDPSGHSWFSKAWKKVKNFVKKYWKAIVVTIIAIVVTVLTVGILSGPMAGLCGAAWGTVATGALAGAAAGFAAGFSGTLLYGGSLSDAFSAGLKGALTGAISGALAAGIGAGIKALELGKYAKLAALASNGLTAGMTNLAQGDSFMDGFLGAYQGAMNIATSLSAAVAGLTACAPAGAVKFANAALSLAQRALNVVVNAVVTTGKVVLKVVGMVARTLRDTLFGTPQELASMDWRPWRWKAWNYVGGGRTNGLDMSQNGLLPNQIGPGFGNNPLPMNDGDWGGVWHDKWFAKTNFGPSKALGDILLAGSSILSIFDLGPTPNAGPVIPSLMTSIGITVASPLHFFGINP